MAEAEKPFTCDVSGCGIKFVCEDKLTSHKRRHNMMLTLNFANTGAGPRNCIEQTPTPTRFMDIIEETGLFQDLQPEFTTPEPAHTANPFDASFRKASSGEIVTKEPSHIPSTSEPLNTPCIMPVTADPLALRPQFTPASAVPKFGPAPLPTPKVEEASSDNTSAPSSASNASKGCSSPDEVTVVAAAAPDTKKLLGAPISDKPATLQVNPTAEAQSAMTGPTPADSVLAATSPYCSSASRSFPEPCGTSRSPCRCTTRYSYCTNRRLFAWLQGDHYHYTFQRYPDWRECPAVDCSQPYSRRRGDNAIAACSSPATEYRNEIEGYTGRQRP
ncbi:cyclic AMP-dependent transcription factor ATF-7 [Rhipicephalus sanguineus]|uniref:cyclic AMP-dependent transcription factor ATF-7 n=1 Tax=Rhipicephalus sanguineus TaxID=34632 RepID=UPI0020C58A21|nr:cyclic AMP-dependent transcription factor ATF-7 [Rhipicephalus sanguineus]